MKLKHKSETHHMLIQVLNSGGQRVSARVLCVGIGIPCIAAWAFAFPAWAFAFPAFLACGACLAGAVRVRKGAMCWYREGGREGGRKGVMCWEREGGMPGEEGRKGAMCQEREEGRVTWLAQWFRVSGLGQNGLGLMAFAIGFRLLPGVLLYAHVESGLGLVLVA
jgi:hypothetical protein